MRYIIVLFIAIPATIFGQDSLQTKKIDLRYSLENEHDNLKIGSIFIGSGLMFTCFEYFILSKERKNDGTPYNTKFVRHLGMGCVGLGLSVQIRSFHRINKRKRS